MASVTDWFSEKALLELAPPGVFLRGAEAAEHGSVQILEQSEHILRARIDETEVYEAEFRLEGDSLTWSCSCGEAGEHVCRHLVGAAFATWPEETPADDE
jgi:uncharacterized Zn finger protein